MKTNVIPLHASVLPPLKTRSCSAGHDAGRRNIRSNWIVNDGDPDNVTFPPRSLAIIICWVGWICWLTHSHLSMVILGVALLTVSVNATLAFALLGSSQNFTSCLSFACDSVKSIMSLTA